MRIFCGRASSLSMVSSSYLVPKPGREALTMSGVLEACRRGGREPPLDTSSSEEPCCRPETELKRLGLVFRG